MAQEANISARWAIDRSAAGPALAYVSSSVFWLLAGSGLGLLAALKIHSPGLLDSAPWLSFGRIRPAHLNVVVYGWVSLAGAGMVCALMGRLCRTPLRWRGLLYASALLWNAGLLAGTLALLAGGSRGLEWLEFPLPAALLVAAAFLLFALSMFRTFSARTAVHVYISLWYILAALVWFPLLYLVANGYPYVGAGQAAMNWWYAHNLLTVWVTPVGLAGAYYFIPMIIGRPVYSYSLGLFGFWTFALFYNWNGLHHLVGGPLPTWAVSLSIAASLLMFIPVTAVAVNHHLTAFRHLEMVRKSPALRFVVCGAVAYTLVSVQGSLEATRTVQEVVHFTHYTVGHAHLGVYGFASMVLFGGLYYMIPVLIGRDWPSPRLIEIHFWTAAGGVLLYVVAATIGGWLQGKAMTDPAVPFLDSVTVTVPYLWARSLGGALMTLGHVAFAWNLGWLMLRRPARSNLAAHEAAQTAGEGGG
jgi:cytochrome c oxidase cbb3-type subunit 1